MLYGARTKNSIVISYNSTLNTKKGVVEMQNVQPIRDPKKLTEILSTLEEDETKHGKRMYLLCATLFYTGLRIGDVVRLQKKHVESGTISVIEQKTKKRKDMPISNSLKDIYDIRLKDMDRNDYLFESSKKRADGTKRPITTRDAGYDMRIIKNRFGITFPFSCHSWRKTHGYMRYKNGENIEALRQHFNHADEETTRRYIGIDEEERNKPLIKLMAGDYVPPKPEKRTRRRPADEALEIKTMDRTENGKKWAKNKAERRDKKRTTKAGMTIKEYNHTYYEKNKRKKNEGADLPRDS